MNTGLSVLILTPEQRQDLTKALVEAIDAVDALPDDPKVARWVALINLLEEGNK